MQKWIAGSTCAAAVLSLAVASAQTDTKSTRTAPQRITASGCLMRDAGAQSARWILSNATAAGGTTIASRSGSPSNEGTSAGNRNGTAGIGVSGSTSTAIGVGGANNPSAAIDTEVNGGGTLGATDRKGSTVGAGATEGATAGATGTAGSGGGASTTATGGVSYQLMGLRNPTQYLNKRIEVVGTKSGAGSSSNQMLRVSSIRVLGDTCQ